MCSFGCGEPCKNARDSVTMAPKFTPDEEAEIELMLWEYDRDGRIACWVAIGALVASAPGVQAVSSVTRRERTGIQGSLAELRSDSN